MADWRNKLPSTKRKLRTAKKYAEPKPVDYRPVATNVVVMSPEPNRWVVVAKGKQREFRSRDEARHYARSIL